MRRVIVAAALGVVLAVGCGTRSAGVRTSLLSAFPVREFRAPGDNPRLAIFLTGDGGWRRVDERITRHLLDTGISVVGFETPEYFATRRTPEETARDVGSVIETYRSAWHKEKIVLIGYSRGGDVLPFIVTRLPEATLRRISVIALLGVEHWIDFRYTPFWWEWFGYRSREKQYSVIDEIARMRTPTLCFYGIHDRNSICPLLPAGEVRVYPEPGGHHFAGDYGGIAAKIAAAAAKP